jgi:hypothetical protein
MCKFGWRLLFLVFLFVYFGLGFWVGLILFWFRFWNQSYFFSFPYYFVFLFFFLHVAKLSSSGSLHAFTSERDPCRDHLVDEAVSFTSQKSK